MKTIATTHTLTKNVHNFVLPNECIVNTDCRRVPPNIYQSFKKHWISCCVNGAAY